MYQLEKLESSRQVELERDQVKRLRVESDQTNEELRTLRSAEIQQGRDRDEERHTDKKSSREMERRHEDLKLKLVSIYYYNLYYLIINVYDIHIPDLFSNSFAYCTMLNTFCF